MPSHTTFITTRRETRGAWALISWSSLTLECFVNLGDSIQDLGILFVGEEGDVVRLKLLSTARQLFPEGGSNCIIRGSLLIC